MDKLFNKLKKESEGELYNKLAPLYDFIYDKHYCYDNQKELIDTVATKDTKVLLEGACGTGRLTKRLIDDYDTVISVDFSEGMISQAREKVPKGNYIQSDLEYIDVQKNIDLYSILGTSIIHMTDENKFKNVVLNAYNHLNENGKFVFDFQKEKDMKNGLTGERKFEGDKYTVIRKFLTTQSDTDLYRFNFAFKIINNNTNEFVRTSDSILIRAFEVEYLEELLKNIGFKNVEFVPKEKHDYGPEITDYFVATK